MSKIIVLDPGHGGKTVVGGSSPNNATSFSGVLEKEMTLDLAKRIRTALLARAPEVEVILTRVSDINVGIKARAEVAANHHADLFLSIHFNATAGARGVETWVRGVGRGNINFTADRSFAQRVQSAVVAALRIHDSATPDRRVKSDDDRPDGLGVLNDVSLGNAQGSNHLCRACLAEIEFIDHPVVDRLLNTGPTVQTVRNDIAAAIAEALLEELQVGFSPQAVLNSIPALALTAKVEEMNAVLSHPIPDQAALDCSMFKGKNVLESIGAGHSVLVATGSPVPGVEFIQDALNFLSFRNNSYAINLGGLNQYRGYFGERTEASLRSFQKDHDLELTGRVDRSTIHVLDDAVAAEELSHRDNDPAARPIAGARQVVDVLTERVYTPSGAIVKKVDICVVPGKAGYFYKAKMSIDADGAPKCYHPTNNSVALDDLSNATGNSKLYVQGSNGIGPAKGFYVSQTSLHKGPANDCGSFVNAVEIPFLVFPDSWRDLQLGDCGVVYNTGNGKLTHAIFADTNPKVGEASVKTAENLGLTKKQQSPKNGGIDEDVFIYLLFPGTRFIPEAGSPHWPDAKIREVALDAFEKWGGIGQLKAAFPELGWS